MYNANHETGDAAKVPEKEKKKILILSKDERMHLFYDAIIQRSPNFKNLELFPIDISSNQDVENAVELITSGKYDAIITDGKIYKDFDALQVLKTSKSAHPNVPVILLSGRPEIHEEAIEKDGTDFRFDAILTKTADPIPTIFQKVQELLDPNQPQNALG